ncbi:TRAP transporter large permease [Marispirochaeta sp.]|jgi:tripartite ATP-independent transporter DctM subunit|uniref:TRAP transporter large permease n=1 Tax=Marispirochaeta sp. TaxID=2038653 RepID=UPI0029C96963|nr:TRAP transporter large permease [Marispirochaeta sp.]
MITILLIIFGVFIVATVPVAYALGLSSMVWVVFSERVPLIMIPQRIFAGIDSFPLLAIPFFILAGQLMATGGISTRLINVAQVLVGRFKGGLAYVNIVVSMLFAGITGSATADTSSIGSVLIPAMKEKGFDSDFTVAVTATSATIGIIIPPSIPMVIYGILMNQSIGTLFIAGAIPGLMVGIILMLTSGFISGKRDYPAGDAYSILETIKIMADGMLPLFTIVIVLGGIIFGIVTPTEAAVMAVVYSFILSVVVYRSVKITDLPRLMMDTILINGMVMLMVGTATIFSWIITSQELPKEIGNFLLDTISNKYVMLMLFNLVLLFAGAVLDLTPAMIIFIPVLAPIAQYVGIDLIHFGVIAVVNLGIGLFTPPVGACLFVSCSIADISMRDSIRGFIPFYIGMFISLMLVTYLPALSLWLPSLLIN